MARSDPSSLVFVYGTLKRGGANHTYLAGQTFLGTGRTAPGFQLHDLGHYPGMIVAPDDRDGVAGEIWSVDPGCLARLDVLEGLAEGLYRRERVPLLPPFDSAQVEAYLYALGVTGRPAIRGGIWNEKT